MKPSRAFAASALLINLLACAAEPPPEEPGAELPLGDLSDTDLKADGEWGAALTCKTVPDLPPLTQPEIFVSLNGLTLRLIDRSTGFEKVFPVGVGAIETREDQLAYGESLTYEPILISGKDQFRITPGSIQPCKTWWTDPESGQRLPVFAGLPFLSFYGAYAIHGPIDGYRTNSGGSLRRGYVSHGCVRMGGADVLELYARIRGVASVPVRVQREPERRPDGKRVEVATPWIGAECQADADCNYTGGVCRQNRYSGRGFCTLRCTRTCPDRAGAPTTFCIADPAAPGQGICTYRETAQNLACRPMDHFVAASVSRFGDAGVKATACVPGSPGWIGDRCLAAGECRQGNSCVGASAQRPGVCTQACAQTCPDLPGWPFTFCGDEASLGGRTCLRTCTPASGASECPAGFTCQPRQRAAGGTRYACVPA